MGRACCVLGCPSGGDAPSHQIPKNPDLFQKWKNMIYSEKIQHLTDEQISKCAVCYRHFADDDYLVTFRVRKLKRGIVPSLNLPNKPASNVIIKTEPQISDAGTFASKKVTEITEGPKIMDIPETIKISLLEDTLKKEAESCLNNQPQTLSNKYTGQINSTAETFKLNHRRKMSRKKPMKLTPVHLSLLQCKRQAKQYEKTPTIQKLLSFLTPNDIASIKTRIRKSRYSPRVYVKIYHDIAKKKALDQV